jgi:hypothetical protein
MDTEAEMVRNPDSMSDEHFELHMNKRHGDELGGLPVLALVGKSPGLVAAWRAFHRRVHKLSPPGRMQHEHEQNDVVRQ